MTNISFKSFRFLDLPKELRLIVYESLPLYTTHPIIQADKPKGAMPEDDPPGITLIIHGVPIQVLSTCRTIYEEAKPFLRPKLEFIKSVIPRVIVDTGAEHLLELETRMMTMLGNYFQAFRLRGKLRFRQWLSKQSTANPLILRFVHQASIQMVNLWNKLPMDAITLESHLIHDEVVLVFLSVQVHVSPWHARGDSLAAQYAATERFWDAVNKMSSKTLFPVKGHFFRSQHGPYWPTEFGPTARVGWCVPRVAARVALGSAPEREVGKEIWDELGIDGGWR